LVYIIQITSHAEVNWTLLGAITACRFSGSIWFPFWVDLEVLIHFVMSKEEIFITPFGSDKLSIEFELSDELFFSTKRFRFIPSIDIVERSVRWN